jgi:hypothetical protein
LICDALFTDTDTLRAVLVAACNLAHERARAAAPNAAIEKVGLLVTTIMEPVVQELGFRRDSYDFPILVQILDDGIPKRDVAPERWYLSAND